MFTVKAIIPKRAKMVSGAAFEKQVDKVLSQAEEDIKREYRKTVRTWRFKTPFYSKRTKTATEWRSDIGPHGRGERLYSWIDLGTKEHPITPKNAPALVFLRGYKARTSPKVIGSGAMRRFPPLWRVQKVKQKINPREFSETIAKAYQPVFLRNMEKAFGIAAKEFEE